mgnify:CR=1 FL=1
MKTNKLKYLCILGAVTLGLSSCDDMFSPAIENNLGLDYMDLCLIHAPRPYVEMINPTGKTYNEENLAVWKAMEEAYHEGKIRALGVSNFSKEDIANLLENASVKPTINQIKVHIGFTPIEIMEYCKENDILIEAFSPNATGKLFNYPEIMEMAKKYNVTEINSVP